MTLFGYTITVSPHSVWRRLINTLRHFLPVLTLLPKDHYLLNLPITLKQVTGAVYVVLTVSTSG